MGCQNDRAVLTDDLACQIARIWSAIGDAPYLLLNRRSETDLLPLRLARARHINRFGLVAPRLDRLQELDERPPEPSISLSLVEGLSFHMSHHIFDRLAELFACGVVYPRHWSAFFEAMRGEWVRTGGVVSTLTGLPCFDDTDFTASRPCIGWSNLLVRSPPQISCRVLITFHAFAVVQRFSQARMQGTSLSWPQRPALSLRLSRLSDCSRPTHPPT